MKNSSNFELQNDFFLKLPKIELHAHLNGSLSEKTIKGLLEANTELNIRSTSTMIEKGSKRTLKECFEMFTIIHKLTGNVDAITYITKSVIEDFVRDNVLYLELRSTPRGNPSERLSKRAYVEAVLRGIREYQKENPEVIDVRYLLSIDRKNGVEDAEETVSLAKEYLSRSDGVVVGVDFSGNPYAGDATEYIQVLQDAKSAGLKLSLHMAEIQGLNEENFRLLQLPPDRIGHGTFLYEDVACRDLVVRGITPLEICLTSNVKGGTVESYTEDHHHMHKWREINHPYVLCTDDKGVFSTSLSNEYKIAAQTSGMTLREIYDLSKCAIDHIFANNTTKDFLRKKWEMWKLENKQYFST